MAWEVGEKRTHSKRAVKGIAEQVVGALLKESGLKSARLRRQIVFNRRKPLRLPKGVSFASDSRGRVGDPRWRRRGVSGCRIGR